MKEASTTQFFNKMLDIGPFGKSPESPRSTDTV